MHSDRQAPPPGRKAARSVQGSPPETRIRSKISGPALNPAPSLRKHGPRIHSKAVVAQANGPTPGTQPRRQPPTSTQGRASSTDNCPEGPRLLILDLPNAERKRPTHNNYNTGAAMETKNACKCASTTRAQSSPATPRQHSET